MRAHEFLVEVRILQPGNETEPLLDTDTIRVYHGAFDFNTITNAIQYGLTGDTYANRRYSYEANNNPKGLFVTPDLKTAKEFGDYVLEIHTKVSDLEAPVWPGGNFTVQGGMSGTFSDDDEREAERIKQRELNKTHDLDVIKNSDRPELAASLIATGEPQALFTGNLDSNSVRAVWISTNPARINQPYKRYTIPEFIKKLETDGISNRYGSTYNKMDTTSDNAREASQKLVKPRDTVTADELINKLQQQHPNMDHDRIVKILKTSPDYIRRLVWNDRQYQAVINGLD